MTRSTLAAAPSALSFAPSVSAERQTEIASFYGAYTRGEQPKARGLSLHGTRIIGDTPTGPILRFVLFSQGRKRDGDEFMVGGADLSHIRANPRVTWSHKYDQLPVGNWVRIEPMVDVRLGPIIEADAVPLRVDDGSDAAKLSQTLFRMYAAHDLDAVSGGWIPRKLEAIMDEEGRTLGLRHLDSEVLEGAFVLIGADAQALQRAVQARRLPEEHVPFFVRERGSAIYTVRDAPEAPRAPAESLGDLIAQARTVVGDAAVPGTEPPATVPTAVVAEPPAEPAVVAPAEPQPAICPPPPVDAEAPDPAPAAPSHPAAAAAAVDPDAVAAQVLEQLRAQLPGLFAGDPVDLAARAGAVLAKRNLDRLAQARQHFADGAALIDQVLADATRAKGDAMSADEDDEDAAHAGAGDDSRAETARAVAEPAPVLGPDLDRLKHRLARTREDDAAVSELGSVLAGMRRRLDGASRETPPATR